MFGNYKIWNISSPKKIPGHRLLAMLEFVEKYEEGMASSSPKLHRIRVKKHPKEKPKQPQEEDDLQGSHKGADWAGLAYPFKEGEPQPSTGSATQEEAGWTCLDNTEPAQGKLIATANLQPNEGDVSMASPAKTP